MPANIYSVIKLDGHYYAIQSNSYTRYWERYFDSQVYAGVVRLNWVDRGAGLATYSMTLVLNTWNPNSLPYKQGVTEDMATQKANLEATFMKINTQLEFIDPFGNPPYIPGTTTSDGVYFSGFTETIPPYSVPNKVISLVKIELRQTGKGRGITLP
jgi:hypothetical protein